MIINFFYLRWLVLLLLLNTVFFSSVKSQNLIAYYMGNANQVKQYPVNELTHIIFSFCHLKGNALNVSSRRDSLTIQRLVRLKKKNPSLKVILSLGGWGGCETCSDVFSSDSGRLEFSRSVMKMTEYFKTDGLDLDWEFPSLAGYPNHPFRTADMQNFILLVRAIRQSIGSAKEISVILAGFSPNLKRTLDISGIIPYVDRIHLMTYDLIGSSAKFTGHFSSIYPNAWQDVSADFALRYLDSLQIPHNKICIGFAFYGRQYRVLENHDHGLHQPAEFDRFVTMRKIRKDCTEGKGYRNYWDETAMASYKYNDGQKLFITYDDERSAAAKTAYIKEKKLNGIFLWELRQDRPRQGLLSALYQGLGH